jgi:hypothetical protein
MAAAVDTRRLLAVSRERDLRLRSWLSGVAWGYRAGRGDGFWRGWAAAEAEMAAAWRHGQAIVAACAPGAWRERVRRAEIEDRRDAEAHYRQFMIRNHGGEEACLHRQGPRSSTRPGTS